MHRLRRLPLGRVLASLLSGHRSRILNELLINLQIIVGHALGGKALIKHLAAAMAIKVVRAST